MIQVTETCIATGRKHSYTVNDWNDGKVGTCGHCKHTRMVKPFNLISPPESQALCKACAIATVPNYDGRE